MEELVKVTGNEVVASSRDIADKFGKRHTHVLDVIKQYGKEISTAEFSALFKRSEYKASNGKMNYEYLVNRDGFSLLAMGFTGKEALGWKLKYIEAFNRMEEMLINGESLSEEEKLRLKLFSKDPLDVVLAHQKLVKIAVAPYVAQLEEQKDDVEFAKQVSDAGNCIDIGQFSKLIYDEEHIDIGRNKLFDWLRRNGYLMSNNDPYQKYIDAGYFKVIEKTKDLGYMISTFSQTLVTGKGQKFLVKKLKKMIDDYNAIMSKNDDNVVNNEIGA